MVAFKKYMQSGLKVLVGSAVLSALFSCSSEPVNPPAELIEFKPVVDIEREWKRSVGDGGNGLDLSLQLISDAGAHLATIDAFGELYRLESDEGEVIAEHEFDEPVLSGLGQDQSYYYYVNFQGELVSVDKETLNQLWRRKLAGEAVAAPSSDGRTVVVQTINGSLHAFDVAEGIQLWRYDSINPVLSLRGTARPSIIDNQVVSGFANGSVVAFNTRSGEVLWKQQLAKPKGRTELERLVDADGSPIVDSGVVFGTAYQGDVVAMDLRSGAELWSKPASTYRGLAVNDRYVFVSLENGSVKAFNRRNGAEAWTSDELSYRRLSAPVLWGTLVAVSDFEGYMHFLSIESGRMMARVRPDSDGVMGLPIADGNRFYVYTQDGSVVAYQLNP